MEKPWRNPDRTYSVNSTVTITPTEEDREWIFSCRVYHESLQQPLQEDFHLVYEDRSPVGIIAACCVTAVILIIIIIAGVLYWKRKLRRKDIGPFIMRDIEGPPKLMDGEEATLHCTVDNCPKNLYVTWLIKRCGQVQEILTSEMKGHSEEEEMESLLDTSYVIKSQREGRQCSTSLSFIPHTDNHKDVTFICRGVSYQHRGEKRFHCTVYVKPKMSQPVTRSLLESGKIKYLLNLEKFYPKSIRIVWTCGVGRTGEVVSSTESMSDNPDKTYNVSSEVRIPEDRHKDPGFRVRVTWEHESMDQPESRELSIRDPAYAWYPVVEEIQVPRLLHGSPATLQCNISEYFPDAVTVKWLRRPEQTLELYEGTDAVTEQKITSRREADNTYSGTASLTITPTLGAEYICLVDHPSLERPIEKSTGRLQVIAKPQMLGPIQITLEDPSRVQFSLNLQKFYPKDIKISWLYGNASHKYVASSDQTFTSQDNDVTYDVTSAVRITSYIYKEPETEITVIWEHEAMEIPETRSLSVRDLPWRPHVGSINVPELKDGKEAKVTCDISGYFPDLLCVTWFSKKDGKLTALPMKTDGSYKTSHKRQRDYTYSCEASLTFTPLLSSHQGSEMVCRVEHPSLEHPIERSSGPLHIGDSVI